MTAKKGATPRGVSGKFSSPRGKARPGVRSPKVDMERLKADYRANKATLRELAALHGCSEAVIRKYAKKYEWERDLEAEVQRRAQRALVRTALRTAGENPDVAPETEEEAIAEAADAVVRVVRTHRTRAQRAQELNLVLLEQLTMAVGRRDDIQTAIEDLTIDDKSSQRYNSLMKLVSIPTHIAALKDIAFSMRTLNGVERQAYGLADVEDPTPPETGGDRITPLEDQMAAVREKLRLKGKKVEPPPDA